jgi:hypothetical protein
MKPNTEIHSDQGSALVDLIGFGVLLQIPILMFSVQVANLQQQSFAVDSIARHALRAHVLWPDQQSTAMVVSEMARDLGIDQSLLHYAFRCTPNPNCQEKGTIISIEVSLGDFRAQYAQPF